MTADQLAASEPAPLVVDWPATAGLEGEVVYQLTLAGVLPGDPVC